MKFMRVPVWQTVIAVNGKRYVANGNFVFAVADADADEAAKLSWSGDRQTVSNDAAMNEIAVADPLTAYQLAKET